MNNKIIKIAEKKLVNLIKEYDGFINVVVDNWRGYRFVFDTEDVRNCKNNCKECKLYNLLKNEKQGYFNSGLYLASEEDKKIFGNKKYLNCKTLEEYKKSYIDFINKKICSKEELAKELNLVKNFAVIYSKNMDIKKIEESLKKEILEASGDSIKKFKLNKY